MSVGVLSRRYKVFFTSSEKHAGGYAGTGLMCRQEPLSVKYGIGIAKHDDEGRVITAEFDKFFFVNACTPPSYILLLSSSL